MADDRLTVGLVRGVHGLRGALRIEVLSDNPERFAPGEVLFREGSDAPLTIISAQRDGPGLLVRFREVTSRDAADQLRDAYLEAPGDDLPEKTWYWHDIVGCGVTTETGDELGRVADIFRVGEAEVYVVRGPLGEVLVPAVESVIRVLEPEHRRIVVDAHALGLTPEANSE